MTIATAVPATGVQLGYARVSTGHQSLDQQLDALTAAGVNPERVYSDKLSGTSSREQRPGLAALLNYARPGDAIVVVGIDPLGRNAAEVMTTIRNLASGISPFGRCARGSTHRTPPDGWWRASLPAWRSLNWNSVGSAAPPPVRHAGHAGSTSGVLKFLTSRSLLWRSECTRTVSRPAPSRRH
jgi:hypothetical protein